VIMKRDEPDLFEETKPLHPDMLLTKSVSYVNVFGVLEAMGPTLLLIAINLILIVCFYWIIRVITNIEEKASLSPDSQLLKATSWTLSYFDCIFIFFVNTSLRSFFCEGIQTQKQFESLGTIAIFGTFECNTLTHYILRMSSTLLIITFCFIKVRCCIM